MSDEEESLSEFCGTARLFPLPNLVLFPSVIQPLHVFEPRYRQMMTDALAGDRLLALVLLKPGWEEDYHLCPPVHAVACLGRITNEQVLDDGRYNLLLQGLGRIRIVEELPDDRLYRSARVELLQEQAVDPAEECLLRQELARRAPAWFSAHGALDQVRQLLQTGLPLGTLCDIFSFILPLQMDLKQSLLEELDAARRARRLMAGLDEHDPPPPPKPADRKFPPAFSSN